MTLSFTLVTFCITLQDIAIDGWATTMLHPENVEYASTCSSVGQLIGGFISTTVYMSLNSVDFCNNWIYSEYKSAPLLDQSTYLKLWAYYVLGVSLYTVMFMSEKGDHSSEDKTVTSLTEATKACWHLVKRKPM